MCGSCEVKCTNRNSNTDTNEHITGDISVDEDLRILAHLLGWNSDHDIQVLLHKEMLCLMLSHLCFVIKHSLTKHLHLYSNDTQSTFVIIIKLWKRDCRDFT